MFGIVEIILGKINTEKRKKYFLLHKTSIKQLFCKATNIIAEIQKATLNDPERNLNVVRVANH